MPFKILTIPYNKKTKTFETRGLNRFCEENLIVHHKIEFVNHQSAPYWTIFLEYKDTVDDGLQNQDIETMSSNMLSLKSRYNITEREMDVMHCVVRGMSNKSTAKSMNITESTVKAHLSSIYAKIGACNRVQMLNRLLAPDFFNGVEKIEKS